MVSIKDDQSKEVSIFYLHTSKVLNNLKMQPMIYRKKFLSSIQVVSFQSFIVTSREALNQINL